jgi:hypothetical protein
MPKKSTTTRRETKKLVPLEQPSEFREVVPSIENRLHSVKTALTLIIAANRTDADDIGLGSGDLVEAIAEAAGNALDELDALIDLGFDVLNLPAPTLRLEVNGGADSTIGGGR